MPKSAKSKRKTYNPDKRAQRFFSNTRLWSWESDLDRETSTRISYGEVRYANVWRPLNTRQVQELITRVNNWVVLYRALCWFEGWAQPEVVHTSYTMKNVAIKDFKGIHDQLKEETLEKVQTRHIVDAGWLVQSFGRMPRTDDPKLPLVGLPEASEEHRTAWRLACLLEQD